MSITRWLSALQGHMRSQKSSPRRRRVPLLLGGVRDWLLEDRCLLSATTIYVASNPATYTINTVSDPKNNVMFLGGTSPNTGNFQWGTVPTKLVTFKNDSSTKQTIYPFLYDHNDVKSYDPIDTTSLEYRIYIGYNAGTAQNPKYTLGLPYNKSITIAVPLVFWNAGRADIAVDSANLIPKDNNGGTPNPFYFFYDSTMSISTQGVMPSSTVSNGFLLYYRATAGPHSVDPSSAGQAQLTEWTIRDQPFLTKVNTYIAQYNSTQPPANQITPIAASQLVTLFNYDVSYVDAMLAPVAMTALSVPVPIQYILGVASPTQTGNTTTITTPAANAAQFASLFTMLTSTYNYKSYEWDVKYNDTSTTPTTVIELGKVTSITKNGNGSGSVTVTWMNSGSAPKLPTGANAFVFYTNAVTQDYGWTGANNDIGSLQNTMSTYTTNSATQAATKTTQSSDKTTTTITLKNDANLASLLQMLTNTYPYQTNQWQILYNDPKTNQAVVVGNVTNVNSGGVVTVQSSTPVSGLPSGAASYVFSVNGLGEYFTTPQNPGGVGWPEYYNSSANALLKIPSGANILIDSPLTTKTSPYDINHFLLTSSGDYRINYGALITSSNQNLKPGATVVFNVQYSPTFTPADLQAMYNANVKWNVTFATKPFGTVTTIDPKGGTITILMNNTIPYNASGYAGSFTAPVSDPYTTKLTNLWYSWAQYYVNQYSGPKSVTVSATVSAVPKSAPADYRLLTLTKAEWAKFGPNGPQLGMLLNGIKFNGQNITILKVVGPTTAQPNNYQIYLSAPVPTTTTSFTFSAPIMTTLVGSTDAGLKTNLIDPNGFGSNKAFATAFAATVYEMLSVYSTISLAQLKLTGLPYNSMAVVYEAIGGNVGFLPTAVPVNYADISADVRDLGKSVLRGVPNYLTYTTITTDADWEPGAWYPPPSTPTDNQNYNVFNVDPYVWFVHQRLGLSGYGFSFDDDVSDIGADGATAITVTYASGPAANPMSKQWFPSTPWGNVTATATISAAGSNPNYPGKSILTIQPQDVKKFWQVFADDKINGLVGAYVTGTGITPGTNLFFSLGSNTLQFVLSGAATPTLPGKTISVTFTAYKPTSQTSTPPVSSPPPVSSTPPVSSPTSSSAPSPIQELVALANNEFLMTMDQVLALDQLALGLVPNPALESAIAAYQNAINANPFNNTFLGQAVILFTEMETLDLLMSLGQSSGQA